MHTGNLTTPSSAPHIWRPLPLSFSACPFLQKVYIDSWLWTSFFTVISRAIFVCGFFTKNNVTESHHPQQTWNSGKVGIRVKTLFSPHAPFLQIPSTALVTRFSGICSPFYLEQACFQGKNRQAKSSPVVEPYKNDFWSTGLLHSPSWLLGPFPMGLWFKIGKWWMCNVWFWPEWVPRFKSAHRCLILRQVITLLSLCPCGACKLSHVWKIEEPQVKIVAMMAREF